MRNIKLTLAYDGSEFHGWAVQPGLPTVQGTLIDTISRITSEKVHLDGAGRTDAGVHALGQVAHFKTRARLPAGNFQRALNSLLPGSLRVLQAEEVALEFHARWYAVGKTYRYRILRRSICPPFLRHYVYHYPYPLDLEAMVQAAPFFEGEHDFSSFGTWDRDERDKSKVRTISSSVIEWDPASQELVYTVRGRAFLRYMVRKIVGTLIAVGKGVIAPEDIPAILEARDRSRAGPTAPPEGLYMVEVEYPKDYSVPAQTWKDSV